MPKKKLKVEIHPGAMKDIPEEDRAGLLEELKRLFEGVEDPGKLGVRVEELPPGPRVCPMCGTPLTPRGVVHLDGPDGKTTQFFDCPKCDRPFSGEPVN